MELSAEATSKFVQAGPTRIHYHEAGSGTVLLAIHGGAPGAYGWGNFGQNLARLSQHFRVLIVDLPGYGGSDKPVVEGGRYGFYAETFAAMLAALDIRQCHIVGLATGGCAGLMMALRHPGLIGRLVVVAPPAGPSLFAPAPSEGAKHIMGYYGGDGPSRAKMRNYLETIIYDRSRITDELIEDRYRVSIDPDFMRTAPEGHAKSAVVEPIWQELSRVEVETQIIWGRENRVVGFDVGLFMLGQMPKAHLNIYSRTGLWLPWAQAERFERDVIGFLQ